MIAIFDLPFCPLPGFSNPHVQTVLGNLWVGHVPPLISRPRAVRLADGDQLLVYDSLPDGWASRDWVALLIHGLGGCHQAGTLRRMAAALLGQGFRVVRINLRGAGPSLYLCRQLYNGGCSADIREVLHEIQRLAPDSPQVLIGFSLGGNIALKLAGEAADNPISHLAGVAAVSAPIDLIRCCEMLAGPRNRFYDHYYTRKLVLHVRRHQRHFRDLPRVRFARNVTLRQFDDLHTAPRWGFTDALDYYRKASALWWVPRIRVPSFLLTARDDPFIAAAPYEELPPIPLQEVHIAASGGHLGFLGPDGAGGIRWADRRVLDWVLRLRAVTGVRA